VTVHEERALARIDLDAVRANVRVLAQQAPQQLFMAVVKADGYGHGMVPVGRAARDAGADYLGVALPIEALHLRSAGDTGPILCWLFPPGEDLSDCIAAGVEVSAASPATIEQIVAGAVRTNRRARVHLKIDTGLGRNGAQPADWEELVRAGQAAQRARRIELVGVWSHLACADTTDTTVTDQQVAQFEQALAVAAGLGFTPSLRHLASSGGVLAHPPTRYDLVRCGISIYGLSPGPGLGTSADLDLTPAMAVTASVALVKAVPAGHGVSYGLRYRTATDTQLALIPVGYADGVPRAGSGVLPIGISGRRYRVAGTVAMDQVVVDIGADPVRAGDRVDLFGSAEGPSADEWAAACGTINYEIVTRLGVRIPRRYVGG
jgi:alanine racemase